MKKPFKPYMKLFLITFYLSAFTVGGGYVIVPLMRRKFVENLRWIEEDEMLDLIAIAQSTPGAIAVNASILVGYRLAGVRGALVTVLGTVLPPLIIISIVSIAYTAFKDNEIVRLILKGLQIGVAAVIASVVITMVIDIMKDKRILPVFIMTGVFIAAVFFEINVAFIILACFVTGIIDTLYRLRGAG